MCLLTDVELLCGFVHIAGVALLYLLWQELFGKGKVIESERHGGELVAKVLQAHGVKFLFTLVGGHISPILVESKKHGIRVVDVRHEASAVFAADAVARLTGVPGVAAVTAGPGLTNTITAVKNAQMAQSPLVLIGGAAASILKGRGALQDIDQMALFKPLCKYCVSCKTVREIVPKLRIAFREAASGVPGPVFVEFPIDALYPIGEVRANMGLCDRKRARDLKSADEATLDRLILPVEATRKGVTAKEYVASKAPMAPVFLQPTKRVGILSAKAIVNGYLRWYLNNLFAGAWDASGERHFQPLTVTYPKPKTSDVDAVARMLKSAKKPVIVIQSQALLGGPERANALREALLSIGAPVFLGGMGRGLLGPECPYHIKQGRTAALRESDLVILLGTVCDFRMNYGRCFSRKTRVVIVNRSAKDLKMNADMFWKAKLSANADPGRFACALADAVEANRNSKSVVIPRAQLAEARATMFYGDSTWRDWFDILKTREDKRNDSNREKSKSKSSGRLNHEGKPLINPLDLCYKANEVMSENAILVADGGDFVGTAAYTMNARKPLGWLDPGAFGTLGVGGGFALGAALACPDSEVWLIWGDGSSGYTIAEYDTFARHNLGVIGLIGNDACWTQIEREQIPILDDDVACPLAYCDYDVVAKGYGGEGVKLSDPSKITAALKKATKLAAQGKPVVVNALIGKSDFREGSISV